MKSLPPTTLHLAIDMQRIFAEDTSWHTPSLARILPNVARIARAKPEATVYTRFIVPRSPADAPGQWRTYYERWAEFTLERMDPSLVDLVSPLAQIAVPGAIVDKPTYSVFEAPGFGERLAAEGITTLVFTGVETDVCVLASLMAAVDRGFRVIAVADAMTSSDEASHRAILDLVFPRMPDQIEILDTDTLLAAWR